MRLQKFISRCGYASRRKAEELILEGKVTINGDIITELGTKVKEGDFVKVSGKTLKLEESNIYILLNKPVGYITSSKDQFERETVLDLVKGVKERIYPVGRLDYDTSGLLILTNDGDFTLKMTHPKNEVEKTYLAKVKGIPSTEKLELLRNGIRIENYVTAKAKIERVKIYDHNSLIKITIHEGKNRQVRKMFDKIGHSVRGLQRVQIGNLKIGELKEGKWRYISPEEIKELMKKRKG